MNLNPFKYYNDRNTRRQDAADRAAEIDRSIRNDERAAFLTALQSITSVAVEASKASQAQAQALQAFLAGFAVTTPPQARGWDESEDNKRYIEQHIPVEMRGLNQLEQFEMLRDILDGNA